MCTQLLDLMVNADEISCEMVHAVSRVPSLMKNYNKLKQKWTRHLPLGKLTGDVEQDLMKIFPRQFKGIGFLPGVYEIDLYPEAASVQLLARDVPEALREPSKKELNRMMKLGIISRACHTGDRVGA